MVSIPSSGDRVSRWTPIIFACALISFMLAQLLLVAGLSWPAAPEMAGPTLAAVHLLTIGWITLLMFGALFQFVPVVSANNLCSQRLSLATLVLVDLGLVGMVAGFCNLGTAWRVLLPAGGSLVILGALAGTLNLAIPLSRKRPLPLSARFIITALVMFWLTLALGLSFALTFTAPALAATVAPVVAGGVEYHMLAGIGGWFTLTAIGVSYELLPMFMLAPHDRGAWGRAVFGLTAGGFALALIAGLLSPTLPGIAIDTAEQIGRIVLALGIALYLADIVRLYRSRRRRLIELHNRAAVGAFAFLGAGLVLAILAAALHRLDQAAPTLVFLLIFGWLSGFGLSQLYKIVPFLAWLSRFGRRLGTERVPRVQDLVNERAAVFMFAAYFLAVAAATVAMWFELQLVVRGAVGVALVATILLGREYVRAWLGTYAARPTTPAVTSPLLSNKGAGHDRARATHA